MIIPSLVFSGKCSQAISFYENAFNCTVKMCQQYGDYVPEGVINQPDNLNKWILHAEMEVGGSTIWLADEIQRSLNVGSTC